MQSRQFRPSGDLTVFLDCRGDAVVLELRGAAGLDETELLDAAVAAALELKPRVVVLNLTGMYFLTSLAIRAFLRVHNVQRERGGYVRIAGASPDLVDVLARTEIHRVIRLFSTIDEALGAPGPSAVPAPNGTGPRP